MCPAYGGHEVLRQNLQAGSEHSKEGEASVLPVGYLAHSCPLGSSHTDDELDVSQGQGAMWSYVAISGCAGLWGSRAHLLQSVCKAGQWQLLMNQAHTTFVTTPCLEDVLPESFGRENEKIQHLMLCVMRPEIDDS